MTIGAIGATQSSYPILASRSTASAESSSSDSTSAAADSSDELTLSAGAQSSSGPLGRTLWAKPLFEGVPRGANGSINLEDIRTACNERRISLNARIQEMFDEAGIDTSQDIRLQTGYDGQVVVANDHPQREQIEQLFRDDPELRNQFVEVDAMSSLVRAGDEAVAFQKAYAKDPYAAVAEYAHLFDNSPDPKFSLLIRGDQAITDFVA